jgi:NTP pyrophosphatase (non-canonical NTP hydrolase)
MLKWAHETFGGIENFDPCTVQERARRFLEEAIELCQAVEVTRAECDVVADYVYARPAGTIFQEIGGVMVTLNTLAEVCGESVARSEAAEWERVQAKSKAHFEARHREKMAAGL